MSLKIKDPEVYDILEGERRRQLGGIQLIASENLTSDAVREALGSYMSHKYSEGYPGARYYSGSMYMDQIELLCQKRALEAFNLDDREWGVNVQALSGSLANFAVYNALLRPHDRIMGLDLSHGGHLTHGYMTAKKRISATSVYFESMSYQLDLNTGRIDYDALETSARLFRPKLIVAGASSYPRLIDYERMRRISDEHGAYLMADIAHIAGLIVANEIPSPFSYADVVTTTTHKTLRGPRGAIIFYRINSNNDSTTMRMKDKLGEKINRSIFPGIQGGPHNHTIAAISVCLKEASTPEFKEYQSSVKSNCQTMSRELVKLGYSLVSGGSDNHMLLIDLNSKSIDGARVETVAEIADIFLNRNSIPGDNKPLVPGGIRIGTPYMTTRGFNEKDFLITAKFLDTTINITQKINQYYITNNKAITFTEFCEEVKKNPPKDILDLKKKVRTHCKKNCPI